MFAPPEDPGHRRQLRDSVTDLARRAAPPAAIRTALAADPGFCPVRWRQMADLGWTAVLLPEDAGGLGMAHADLAALHQEAGRAALPEPLVAVPLLAMQALARGDNADLRDAVLPGLMAGEVFATLAWQGRAGALGAGAVGPRAVRAGAGWHLSGQALFVPLADVSSGHVVAADTGAGVLLAWVGAKPAVVAETRQVDGARMATITLDGVEIGPEAVIAGPETGAAVLDHILDTARLAVAAELLGGMERAFEMTLDHLKTRVQFGQPLAAFQALQHRAVGLFVQIEIARSALLRAVAVCDDADAAPGARVAAVSAAKARCGEVAQAVARECIQMSGAIGYTAEYDLSLYVNRALAGAAWLGNPRAHRARWFDLHAEGVA
ncbi:acyl-CoA dehydrogenase family protein [Ruixingdingia sedimenti]|uniref:Acyl-CoA dehydrogenase family protein n=1 Tax=Ruixingdingia sedimenti TaxID=3073604 RepID=A0ABU1FF25_9RHOB|nr:acyl-CoA dehydrogenase family protein [Xinfangfangia sp. LG-4]MDR5655462.1 acyl-CoA dehydrogenase family protein [Xinfangfangia sp. LG-4]